MTAQEKIELAEARKDIQYMKDDLQEVKGDIKVIKEMLQEDRDTHKDFVTKTGLTKLASVFLTLTVLFFLFFDHIKDWMHGK